MAYNEKNKELANEIIKEKEQAANDRCNFESQYQEIAERMLPSESRSFNTRSKQQTKGDKRTEFLFDSTASIAIGRFSAILDSLLTPRNQTWHKLQADSQELNKSRRVKLYFEDVTRILFKERYAPTANFASQNNRGYTSIGAYGTAALFTDELAGHLGLRYKHIHLSQLFLGENHQGIVDKVYREFPMTARQAFQKWGEATPDDIKNALKTSPEREYYFIHCVKPRKDLDPERLDYKGMKHGSYYVSVECRDLIEESGYRTFPYAVSRYEQYDTEIYGRSPAMMVLPASKTLNEQKKTMLKLGHRSADPVLLGPDDGVLDSFSLRPGDMNFGGVTSDGRPLVHTLPVGNYEVSKDMMDQERMDIKDAFLLTLFQILVETPQATATEVMERTREKGILLAPTVGRQEAEKLGPMIERELDILAFQGKLPPLPPELVEARGEYRVVYDSPLSRAQRAEEASGFMRVMETALQAVNITQDPSILDHLDFDTIIPEISEISGMPTRWTKSKEQIQAIREGRAQQQQMQTAIQAAPGAAALIKSTAVAKKGGA